MSHKAIDVTRNLQRGDDRSFALDDNVDKSN